MNGKERNISQFRKLSAYIMQDNQLHGNLTVEEAMTVATNLKLSSKVSKNEKSVVVSNEYCILNKLFLVILPLEISLIYDMIFVRMNENYN